jgi:NTE family protein
MVDITLALGGGGSKGYAHLGVIRGLEKLGFNIRGIAGTSAGGMAAAVYASGYSPDELLKTVTDSSQDGLYGFGRGPALLGTKGIQEILERFLQEKTFEDLNIPCAMTAVDLKEMREIVIREGKVIDAVMATIAVPGIFPPKEMDNYLLVDGMVLNPVPVDIARSLSPACPVIAVPLSPVPEQWKIYSPWGKAPENPLLRPISRLRIAKAFEVYLRSMDMTAHMLGEIRLEMEKPDLVIRPEVGHINAMDKVNIEEVVELGDRAVDNSLTELNKLLKKRKRRRWFKRT